MSVVVRESIESDPVNLAPIMRQSDVRELEASHGIDPLNALDRSYRRGHWPGMGWTAVDGDKVLSMFGCNPLSLVSNIGVPWMLATDIESYTRDLLKIAPVYLELMKQRYDYIFNYVHADNDPAVRFLLHLGFNIYPPEPYGRSGELFHKFEMRCLTCVTS